MTIIPENLHYSRDHEWIAIEDSVATLGITDHAQKKLGDIAFVELPKIGDKFERNEEIGVVESVKAASEIFTPVAGEIVEVNDGINEKLEVVNSDPYGEAWFIKIKMNNPLEADKMLTAAEYEEYLAESE